MRWVRTLLSLLIYGALLTWTIRYGIDESQRLRLNVLLYSNATVSAIQQQSWFERPRGIQPGDRIFSIDGQIFDDGKSLKSWIQDQTEGQLTLARFKRGNEILETGITIRTYNRSALNLLFFLPLLLSVIFFGIGIAVPLQKLSRRRNRQASEVFSFICLMVSFFFMSFFPAVTQGLPFSMTSLSPLMGALMLHLFLVYPKVKGSWTTRLMLLGSAYGFAIWFGGLHVWLWSSDLPKWLRSVEIPFIGICLSIGFGALLNTLLTSRDFWARRRARLLSVVSLASFTLFVTAFVAFVHENPPLIWERILSVSLVFPAAFAVVFLKGNVFDLERIFKRGFHQFLMLGIATTIAILIGVSFSEWTTIDSNRDWSLWVLIAIAVIILSRPLTRVIEEKVKSMVLARVRYPKVDEIFEKSVGLEAFLTHFCSQAERNLNLERIQFRFMRDPNHLWKPGTNEQRWDFREGAAKQVTDSKFGGDVVHTLFRGATPLGEICFSGGDAIAFDPDASRDWSDVLRSLSRVLEILILRDFMRLEQGLLAVGRMQALLAHEMKNPLAIIKVCSGLLSSRLQNDDEAEELVKTIQDEVARVSQAVQGIFEHSGKPEPKQKINLVSILAQVKEAALSRFPGRDLQVSFFRGGVLQEDPEKGLWIWAEKEALRQSLTNLVINAFEAKSGWVGIEVHLNEQSFHILVKDHGPGLPKDVDLFKPFATTKANGTGLGLAMVKSFAEKMGGQVRVKSSSVEGTTFSLDLPKHLILKSEGESKVL